ncbi:PAS domain S-box protein [Ancylomarina euxinus]|uniref:histidine kinase n=1 Tax=Ancylomarina euxinus TaxID=2283627 RepID=A0A425Y2E6_9BACT|nr:PAS domain S-box protein [Ancylomarina euxinus]MCZ4694961.1 PAS domain S-box protein [Ancylomarina euxinus]MUP14826.1 PAS domain S-box protein [Ancylomarina euxinus]RRG22169.1 PAS domain S-box protein [Ancylomarina euxinus]
MKIQYTAASSKYHFPDTTVSKWQKLIDLLSKTFKLPSTLIMELDGEWMKVFARNENTQNPYQIGYRESLHGLYCTTVINTGKKLSVPNALKDPDWMKNPDIKLGMIAYLGFPIYLPNKEPFGTICVLDNKENVFSKDIEQLLLQIKNIIELDIASFQTFESKSQLLEENALEQMRIINQTKKSYQKISRELKKEQDLHQNLNNNNKQLNHKLKQSEIKYTTLFSKLNSGVVLLSPICSPDGKLVDATYLDMNPMNEKLLGMDKKILIGKNLMSFFPKTEQAWLDTFEPVINEGKTINIELYNKNFDRHFSVNAFPMGDGSFCINYFDISDQIHLREKIEESEFRYKSFYNSIEAGIAIFEPIFNTLGKLIDIRYVDMNPVNETIIDAKCEDLIGKRHSECFPDTHDEFLEYFKDVLTHHKGKRFEKYYPYSSKYYSTNIFPIDKGLIAFTCYDITESVQAKQELEASEKRHKAIFENSSSSMVLIDPETGTILDANKAVLAYTGYSKEEFLDMDLGQISQSGEEELKRQLKLALDNEKNYYELKYRLASGEVRDIEVYTGKIEVKGKDVLHSVVHDITDKKNAFKEVLKLSKAVEQSPVSVVITDLNGNIEYSNPRNCELTGYTADELISKNPRVLKSGKLSKDVYIDLWNTILAGEKWEGEFYNRKKDGSFYWEVASIAPITNEEGTPINFIKIGKDITNRKMMELELRKSKLEAEESDRLKTAFLANLSHEVRTPLNGIIGFTNLMMNEDTTAEVKHEYGNVILESGNQLMMIIDDLVKIAEIEAGKLSIKQTEFLIIDLFNEILQFYKPEIADKALKIKISNTFNIACQIKSDHKRIRQIMDNLIKNAIKFTNKGEITLGAQCHKTHVLFSIKDTGIGISKTHQKVIFNRFRQIENHNTRLYGGNGLGLSISKEIVELMGGELWVESEEGKGSTFNFTIPI